MSEADAMRAIGKRVVWAPPELRQPPWRGVLLGVEHGAATIHFDGRPRPERWPYVRDLELEPAASPGTPSKESPT